MMEELAAKAKKVLPCLVNKALREQFHCLNEESAETYWCIAHQICYILDNMHSYTPIIGCIPLPNVCLLTDENGCPITDESGCPIGSCASLYTVCEIVTDKGCAITDENGCPIGILAPAPPELEPCPITDHNGNPIATACIMQDYELYCKLECLVKQALLLAPITSDPVIPEPPPITCPLDIELEVICVGDDVEDGVKINCTELEIQLS